MGTELSRKLKQPDEATAISAKQERTAMILKIVLGVVVAFLVVAVLWFMHPAGIGTYPPRFFAGERLAALSIALVFLEQLRFGSGLLEPVASVFVRGPLGYNLLRRELTLAHVDAHCYNVVMWAFLSLLVVQTCVELCIISRQKAPPWPSPPKT